jgi:NADH:ubiquinone oxidoreductase subunit 5 (subunit L)/multisubunit Na+/H+ antiporter MnhA subunit
MYYRQNASMVKIRNSQTPLKTILKHGYFFDDLYEKVIARGTTVFSGGVRFFENTIFGVFPQLVAGFVISFAIGVHKYLDVLADQLLSIVANRTLLSASKMKKVPQSSLQHYLAAALLGFILILVLIIATIGV